MFQKIFLGFSMAIILFAPVYFVSAETKTANTGLVTCGMDTNKNGLIDADEKCTFKSLGALVEKIMHFLIFQISLPLAAIMFAYAGWLLISSGASEENRTKAKGIIINVFIGLAVALAAVIIVKSILSGLGYHSDINFII